MPTTVAVLYNLLREIPTGYVSTYGAIARHFNTSPRVIASMLAANTELDCYPCYKVIYTDGRVGGYRGGVAEKIRRLKKDGISVSSSGRIDMKVHGFDKFLPAR